MEQPTTTKALEATPQTVHAEAVEDSSLGYAWYVVIVLMACYALSFVDRQVLSLLVGPIKRDLAISDTRVGLLQGFAFTMFYTLVGLPLGRIADTRSRRNLIAAGIFAWSLMTSACAAAKSFLSLFLVRMGVGVGEATLSPAALSLISDYFPKKSLSRALSVYSMGIFIGSGLALIVGGSVIQAVTQLKTVQVPLYGTMASWRLTFLAVGLPGLIFVPWLYSVREPLRKNLLRRSDGQASKLNLGEVLDQVILRWQSVLGLCLGMIFQALCYSAFLSWTPTFFQRMHGWTAGQTGRDLGIIVLSFGCAGMYIGGVLSDHWLQKGVREGALRVGVLSAVGTGILFVLAMMAPTAWWSLVFIAPGMLFLSMPIGSAYAAFQVIFPNQVRGQVSALLLFTLNLGGQSMGPFFPGFLNDYFFKSEKMIGPSIAITIAVASLLQFILFRATYRPYRRHYEMMHPATSAASGD